MHEIGMNKTMGDEPEILPAGRNGRGIKNQVINYLLLAKTPEGNQYGNNNDCKGDCQLQGGSFINEI
jgi:hypothetical protein